MNNQIADLSHEIEMELIQIRRELHRHPELALQEMVTAQILAEHLKKIPGMIVYEHMAEGTQAKETMVPGLMNVSFRIPAV